MMHLSDFVQEQALLSAGFKGYEPSVHFNRCRGGGYWVYCARYNRQNIVIIEAISPPKGDGYGRTEWFFRTFDSGFDKPREIDSVRKLAIRKNRIAGRDLNRHIHFFMYQTDRS